MIEVKVSFDSVGEMLDFFGGKAGKAGKAGSVQQVAQVLKDEVQKVMAEPATPAAQPIAAQPQPAAQPIAAQPQPAAQPIASQPQPQQPQQPAAQPITPQPSQPAAQPITPQQPTKQYTKDELARACAPLANDPESMRMLQELLASYNAVSLHDLDKSQYPDFADKLRNLGVSV